MSDPHDHETGMQLPTDQPNLTSNKTQSADDSNPPVPDNRDKDAITADLLPAIGPSPVAVQPVSARPTGDRDAAATAPKLEDGGTGMKIQGKEYAVMTPEALAECLQQGKAVEGFYIQALTLKSDGCCDHGLSIKNCVIGLLELEGIAVNDTIHFENTRFQKAIVFKQDLRGKGTIEWMHCVFEKPLVLEHLIVEPSLCFMNSSFLAEFDLKTTVFHDEITLTRANFPKKVTIKDCVFHKQLELSHAEFESQMTMNNNKFHSGAVGNHAQFKGAVQWLNCQFDGKADFHDIKTESRFDLEQVRFHDRCLFAESTFGNKFVVKECIFDKKAVWTHTCFKNDVAFPQTEFNLDVTFDGAEFREPAYFDETTFQYATFRGAKFLKTLSFQRARARDEFLWQGTQCEGPVIFDFANFESRVSFSDMIFQSSISCYRTSFKGAVWFLGTRFQDASFVNTNFGGEVFFSFDRNTLRERNRRRRSGPREQTLRYVSLFDGAAKFTNAVFYRKTVFENVFFKKNADFENACFAEEINFQSTHFQGGASFKGCFCTQELDFTKTVFDDYANFDLANINRRLNLTDAAFDRGISFYHAVIDVVVVEHDQIKDRLVYEGHVPGYEDKKHLMRVKEEYLILKESFNQRGKFDEEDWAYYRYRVNDRLSLTQKAWKSLRNEPILAVQDDVPQDEREDDHLLVEQTDKNIEKMQKAIVSYRTRIEKFQNAPADQRDKKGREIADLEEKSREEERRILRAQKEREGVVEVVELNRKRQQKLHASRDKPFRKTEAAGWLVKNSFWKLVDFGTGYGVRPFRIAFLAIAVILVFACVYNVSGAVYGNESTNPNVSSLRMFMNWFYFSAMTFATASPEGDLFYNPLIKFFIMFEALCGVFLMALFVGCYTRKIMR